MLSIGFRIFCWDRCFCHRSESDFLFFIFTDQGQRATPNGDGAKYLTKYTLRHYLFKDYFLREKAIL